MKNNFVSIPPTAKAGGLPRNLFCDKNSWWEDFKAYASCTVEHKPTDKVEPKFHEGEWIVHDVDSDYVYHVESVGVCYHLRKGGSIVLMPFIEEKYYHLWTINDAKDGDILACGNDIVIFKENSYNPKDQSGCMFVYCAFNKCGYWYEIGGINPTYYKPATKEQRDTLMKAMTDEGYTFDFDKKELRKLKFRVGDIVKSKSQPMLDARKIISIGKDCYWCEDRGCIGFAWEDDFELVEQKPANKVEPKFKIGDWLTSYQYGNIVRVLEVLEDNYKLDYNGDTIGTLCTELVDSDYRLWDITKDAKDGDVLAVDNMIFIYERTLASHIVSYCKLINDIFEPFDDARTCCEGNPYVHPATKEQRDTFFAKMKDAGYVWDAQNKKLKGEEVDNIHNYLYGEQKTALSEEDEKMWAQVINEIKAIKSNSSTVFEKNIAQDKIDWLKSLKERYTWKPSDEQIYALRSVVTELKHSDNKYQETIEDLYQDLKKLREE